jgi:hypothetical protein
MFLFPSSSVTQLTIPVTTGYVFRLEQAIVIITQRGCLTLKQIKIKIKIKEHKEFANQPST